MTKEEEVSDAQVDKDKYLECLKVEGEDAHGLVMPKRFVEKYAEKIYHMEVHHDDIWVVTFPKCGTTWTQEIVWSLVTKIDPQRKDDLINLRFPFLEYPGIMPDKDYANYVKNDGPYEEQSTRAQSGFHTLEYVKRMERPRFIKSHLRLSHLPPNLVDKAKVFYVCRHPFDVFVSFYFHYDIDGRVKMSLEEFVKVAMEGRIYFGDYMAHLKVRKSVIRALIYDTISGGLVGQESSQCLLPLVRRNEGGL